MANNDQNSDWDPTSFYFSQLSSMVSDGFYQEPPLDSTFPSQDALVQNPTNLATQSSMPLLLPSVMQQHPSNENWSQERGSSEGSKAISEGAPPTERAGKALSSEAIQRRRQQNRASQLAFRARTKKTVDDLRQQLTQCTEHNNTMYFTMQNLLENAESLKRAIEGALASQRSFIFENQQEEKGISQPSSPRKHGIEFWRDSYK